MSAYDDISVSQTRKVIAQRLSQSKSTIPHYYVTVECEVDKLLKLRETLNKESKSKISVNDMILKAASLASVQVPCVTRENYPPPRRGDSFHEL